MILPAIETASEPLVSVLMPAYNASSTIEFALASLFAQSYSNWECVIVDDGSTDGTANVLSRVIDSRLRVIRFEENVGRGAARIASLKSAKGVYITMLDADDWLYPGKLAQQVAFLESHPDVALHSMGMAISNGEELISVRRSQVVIDREFDLNHRLFIPHAPSMIRRSSIGDVSYDSRFKLAQDQDFLRRVLIGKRYIVVPEIGYCYNEVSSVNVKKIFKGYLYNSFGYLKLMQQFGLRAFFFAALELIKPIVLLWRYLRGGQKYVLASRSESPSIEEFAEFAAAKGLVCEALLGTVGRGV